MDEIAKRREERRCELARDFLPIFGNGEDAILAATMLVMALASPISEEDWPRYLAALERPMCFTVKVVQAINPDTLKKVAELLEIPEAERDQVIHVAVSIRTPSAPTARRRAARAATPAATSRRQR
jgi:hypothetical protein